MRKSYGEMAGEALREIGVLVLVFSVLDRMIAGNITAIWTAVTLAISVVSFLLGCMLERIRNDT